MGSQSANADLPPPLIATPSAVPDGEVLTKSQLVRAFREIGVLDGGLVCVHSWLENIGLVVGGARSFLDALDEAVGPAGTVMMPAFSGDISDPAQWRYPAIPSARVEEVRREMPTFDPDLTPTRKMGMVAELFRHRQGVIRSHHPQSSFCARGPLAEEICAQHSLSFRFGMDSPLGALVRHDGHVLIAGAPWNTASVLYLTEFQMPDREIVRKTLPIAGPYETEWREVPELEYRDVWHDAVAHLVSTGIARRSRPAKGDFLLFSAREAVGEVLQWRLRLGGFVETTPME